MSASEDKARIGALASADPVVRRVSQGLIAIVGSLLLGFSVAELMLFLVSDGPQTAVGIRAFRDFIGLTRDGSFSEWVNYAMIAFAAAMFLAAYGRVLARALLFLGLLMLFIGIDDSLQYHEHFGGYLVARFDMGALPGLRAQDSGELVAWGLAGLFFAGLLLRCLTKRQPGDGGVLLAAAVPFGVLIVSGIGLDMATVAVPGRFEFLEGVLGIAEDGGEMIAVALMARLGITLARNAEAYYGV